jgi:hypothetical protein
MELLPSVGFFVRKTANTPPSSGDFSNFLDFLSSSWTKESNEEMVIPPEATIS